MIHTTAGSDDNKPIILNVSVKYPNFVIGNRL